MTISELITQLEYYMNHYGDIPVKIMLTPSNIVVNEVDLSDDFISHTFDLDTDENEIPYILLG